MEPVQAKGHNAKIYDFDEETVFIPFKEHELNRLITSLESRIDVLTKSGDYPEISEDVDTLYNLRMGYGVLLSVRNWEKIRK